jgi:hypothetical protein
MEPPIKPSVPTKMSPHWGYLQDFVVSVKPYQEGGPPLKRGGRSPFSITKVAVARSAGNTTPPSGPRRPSHAQTAQTPPTLVSHDEGGGP